MMTRKDMVDYIDDWETLERMERQKLIEAHNAYDEQGAVYHLERVHRIEKHVERLKNVLRRSTASEFPIDPGTWRYHLGRQR